MGRITWRDSRKATPVMFIVCSDDYVGADLAAACDAAIVLQVPGGAHAVLASDGRATLEYAVRLASVRDVVVLAHRGCRVSHVPALESAREQALAQWKALTNDVFSHSLFLAHRVDVRLLWIDPIVGEMCDWRPGEQSLVPMGSDDLAQMLAGIGGATRPLDRRTCEVSSVNAEREVTSICAGQDASGLTRWRRRLTK